MNKKRALLVVMCCALVGAFFVIAPVVRASTWVIAFDGGDPLTYTLLNGTITASGNPGNGVYGGITTTGSCGTSISVSSVRVDLPSAMTLTSASMNTKGSPSGSGGWTIQLYGVSNNLLGTYTGGTTLNSTWYTKSSGAVSVASVSWVKFTQSACDATNLQVWIDNLSITASIPTTPTVTYTPSSTPDPATYGWNHPLKSLDRYEALRRGSSSFAEMNGATDYTTDSNLTVVFSNSAGQNVFSVANGTVTQVSQIGACQGGVFSALESGSCLFRWTGDGGTGWSYWNTDLPLHAVFITTDTNLILIYIIKAPQVQAGQTVTAGCLIGKTWQGMSVQQQITLAIPPSISQSTNRIPMAPGIALIQLRSADNTSTLDGTLLWVTEPTGNACAFQTNTPCQLVQNPTFQESGGAWQPMTGHPEQLALPWLTDHGIGAWASVEQPLNLDSRAQYTISLGYAVLNDAYPDGLPQTFTLVLGTTQIPVEITSIGAGIKTIAAASYTADRTDGLYTLGFTGSLFTSGRTTVTFLCVADTTEGDIVPGGGCIVHDPNFSVNSADSPWTLSADPPAIIPSIDGGGGGMAVIPDDGLIYDQITLNPKDGGAQQDYTLFVTFRRQGVAQTDHSMSLDWEFDAQSGTLGPSTTQTWADYTATISVSTDPITADLYLIGNGTHTTEAAQVSMVCVRPTDTSTPPGYRPPPVLDTQVGCRVCVFSPTGDVATDLAEYVQWLGCQFYQLWECQAKILLRYIWQALVNILTLFGFFRLWLSATLINLVQWGNGNLVVFANWLYGQINNAAQQIIYAILTLSGGGGGGTNLWDFLIALINGIFGLLQVFVQLVANIMQLIISGVIGFLVNGVGLLLGLLQSVINGLNTAPATINAAWLPNCNDATSGLFVVCSAIYGVESGLAIGPFQYLVPIGVGLGALNLLWWGIAKIKGVFTE